MAAWWMPVPQLRVMRALEKGFVLLHYPQTDVYWWAVGGKCTPQGRALRNKGLICVENFGCSPQRMRLTPTGKNELGYNRGREID
ncbi:hypothetical protein PWV40_004402 [Salmonella enterica]|nr:hypothetical protein [Salmonella enterica]